LVIRIGPRVGMGDGAWIGPVAGCTGIGVSVGSAVGSVVAVATSATLTLAAGSGSPTTGR
jgi:hypothetical protein